MFVVVLDIDSAGAMTITETTPGISNDLTVSTTGPAGVYDVSDSGIGASVTIGPGAINAGWSINFGTILEGPSDTVTSIAINLGNGSDDIGIKSEGAPVNVTSTGTASVTLGGAGGTTGAQALLQPVNLSAPTGRQEVEIDDTGDPVARDVSVTDTSITGLTRTPVTFGPGTGILLVGGTGGNTIAVNNTQSFGNRDLITIESRGNDAINVKALAATNPMYIATSAGVSDTVNVTDNGSVKNILGKIQIDAQFGGSFASLNVDSSADAAPVQATVNASATQMMTIVGSISGVTATPIVYDPKGLHALNIHAGNGGNTFTVNQSVALLTNPLDPQSGGGIITTIDTGAGDDTVNVQANPRFSTLNVHGDGGALHVNIGGPVADVGLGPAMFGTINLSNAGFPTDLSVDDSNDVAAKSVTVNSTSLRGLYSNAAIQFTDLQSLSVIGTPFPDTFDVSPSGFAAFTIDGGPFAAGANSGDVFRMHSGGASGMSLAIQTTAGGQQGQFTFADRRPVNFLRMGTVSPLIGSIAGHVFSGQNAAAIAGATVFLDLNQSGAPDAGEPATVTDASGAYSFVGLTPGPFRVVQAPPAGLVGTSAPFVDVAVAAGQRASINFADVAAPISSGPDLTASFVGALPPSVIGGSKGKAKLNIAAAGAAAAGNPLIELFASTTGALTPGQAPFATVPAGSLKLRAGGSKTINLSFTYPAGLADGDYFLVASVDPTNLISESNKANNLAVSAAPVTISAPFVDLTGAFGRALPASIGRSAFASIAVTIGNVGNIAAAGAISISLFASTDTVFDAGDVPLTKITGQRVNLKPTRSQSVRIKSRAPAGLATGHYFLISVVNADRTLAERTAANDVAVSSSTLSIG